MQGLTLRLKQKSLNQYMKMNVFAIIQEEGFWGKISEGPWSPRNAMKNIRAFSRGENPWPSPKPGLRNHRAGTSLVAQWLRVCLPMQKTWVRALVREDPACHRATGPTCHNYWARTQEPACHSYWSPHAWSPCSTTREATAMKKGKKEGKEGRKERETEKEILKIN